MSSSTSLAPAKDPYLRFSAVKTETGLSRTTIHRLVKSGDFPEPRQLGRRAVGWKASEVEAWKLRRPRTSEAKAKAEPLAAA